jgi:hypothetical protein
MAQTSVQFTPVQVLQAARRAEAEGKMDYALQFYRHLVEQHGTTPEAQEAREGLFRIAEWRWGEARVARGREGDGTPATQGAGAKPAQQQTPPTPPAAGGQRVYNVANNSQASGYYNEQPAAAAGSGLPQVVARHAAEEEALPFVARFRVARFVANTLSGVGWIMLAAGIIGAIAAVGGFIAELSATVLLGLPLGILLGVPAAVLGLALIVSGQLAAAVFDGTNATLERLAIERGRAGL